MLMLLIMVNDIVGLLVVVKWMYVIEVIILFILFYFIVCWSEKCFCFEYWLMVGLLVMILVMFFIGMISSL